MHNILIMPTIDRRLYYSHKKHDKFRVSEKGEKNGSEEALEREGKVGDSVEI